MKRHSRISQFKSDFSLNVYRMLFSASQRIQSASVTKTGVLMFYREIIPLCSEIHTKHINTQCGQSVELLDVTLAVYKATTGP